MVTDEEDYAMLVVILEVVLPAPFLHVPTGFYVNMMNVLIFLDFVDAALLCRILSDIVPIVIVI